MSTNKPFSWRDRACSFRYAFAGIADLLRHEHNARIHLVAALCAIALGIIFHISPIQWCLIAICIGSVFAAEAFNSAIEAIADKVSPEKDFFIGKAKDLAASAVLFTAAAALAVGLLIFIPLLVRLFR